MQLAISASTIVASEAVAFFGVDLSINDASISSSSNISLTLLASAGALTVTGNSVNLTSGGGSIDVQSSDVSIPEGVVVVQFAAATTLSAAEHVYFRSISIISGGRFLIQ